MPTQYHIQARELATAMIHRLWPCSEYSMNCESMAIKLVLDMLDLPGLLKAKDTLTKLQKQQDEKETKH